jgi:2-dehydro-3-deoxyphosphooctonate aldolase (KDO 8-P synthase)
LKVAGYNIEKGGALFVVAGPCVLEGLDFTLRIAEQLAAMGERLGVVTVFKSSFDKANRTSTSSPRGPGLDDGLEMLARVKSATGLPILTDVHETAQVPSVAEVVDIIQIPAFLSRQTDLLAAAAVTGRIVNIKKGQFMAPGDMLHAAAKVASVLPAGERAADHVILCERGASFGYHDLVVDMRSLGILRTSGLPVMFDATHSVQSPAGRGESSGGRREFVPLLARSAAAAGISGLFIETHPDPASAWSDSATVWPLDRLEALLVDVIAIHDLIRDRQMLGKDIIPGGANG